eukprot:s1013_g11.t1
MGSDASGLTGNRGTATSLPSQSPRVRHSFRERLREWTNQQKAQMQKKEDAKLDQEMRLKEACTFRPAINEKSDAFARRSRGCLAEPLNERLYNDAGRRSKLRAQAKELLDANDLYECTFTPRINAQRNEGEARIPLNKSLEAFKKHLLEKRTLIEEANAQDKAEAEVAVNAGKLSSSLFKRLDVSGAKFDTLLKGIDEILSLPDPIGQVTYANKVAEGLNLYRLTCPIGVLLIIFEARPDAAVQIASLAMKSGNALLLKGGKEAQRSNAALVTAMSAALQDVGLPADCIQGVDTRTEVAELLKQEKYIDLVIPRGSNELVRSIKDASRIPVMGHADGICAVYVDSKADLEKAVKIVVDSKTHYCAACNSMETLLVHEDVCASFLPKLAAALKATDDVHYKADATCLSHLPVALSEPVTEDDFDTEFLCHTMAVKAVASVQEAIDHINSHSSGHTESIVTEDPIIAEAFLSRIDSAGVYHNCSTRFADGFRYGFGAEVGISTNRIFVIVGHLRSEAIQQTKQARTRATQEALKKQFPLSFQPTLSARSRRLAERRKLEARRSASQDAFSPGEAARCMSSTLDGPNGSPVKRAASSDSTRRTSSLPQAFLERQQSYEEARRFRNRVRLEHAEADFTFRQVPSPSDRSSREERHKLKRTDKDLERREEHREDKRQPPEPPKARRETGKRRAKSEEEVDYSRPSEASWKPFKRSKNKGQKHRDRGRAFREGRIAQTRGLDGTAKETSGSSRYPQVPEDDTSSWKPVQDWSPQIGQQVHLRGTYKGEPSECVGEVEGLVDDREGQWVKIALTGSPHEVLKYWRRSNTEEFYDNRKPLLKKLDLKFRGYSVFTSFERPHLTVCTARAETPPGVREGESRNLPSDLTGPVLQLGPLLRRWILLKADVLSHTVGKSSKHHSTAEVFPLPALPWGMPPGEREWMEAAVRALNWLSVGTLALSKAPATTVQMTLLQEFRDSFRSLSKLGSEVFADVPIESYWRSKGVNAYGEEVHCALAFKWANIEHSLPQRELAGALDGAGVAAGGVKHFLSTVSDYTFLADTVRQLGWWDQDCKPEVCQLQHLATDRKRWSSVADAVAMQFVLHRPYVHVLHWESWKVPLRISEVSEWYLAVYVLNIGGSVCAVWLDKEQGCVIKTVASVHLIFPFMFMMRQCFNADVTAPTASRHFTQCLGRVGCSGDVHCVS